MCQIFGIKVDMKVVVDIDIPFVEGVFEPYATVVYKKGDQISREDVIDADVSSDDLDEQQENTELNPADDFDNYFGNGDSDEDSMDNGEDESPSEIDHDFGFDNEFSADVFTDDSQEINKDGCSDFSLDANFSDHE